MPQAFGSNELRARQSSRHENRLTRVDMLVALVMEYQHWDALNLGRKIPDVPERERSSVERLQAAKHPALRV